MLASQVKKQQIAKFTEKKDKIHAKISNNFIESTIHNSTLNALKTIYFLASAIEKVENFENIDNESLIKFNLETTEFFNYTNMKLPQIIQNLKDMQKTSISFINQAEAYEEGIALLPYFKILYGKNKIQIAVFKKIAEMIIEVKNNYSIIDTRLLMSFRSKHTLRFLPLLNLMKQNKEKERTLDLDDLNLFFGTNYKTLHEVELKIFNPIKDDLHEAKIKIDYETNFELLGKGRPKAVSITISTK